MNAFLPAGGRKLFLLFVFFSFFTPTHSFAQIFEPEGLNMPGGWNGWSNPPTNLAFASSTQVSGGRVVKISSGVPRWQTSFSVATSGGDVTGGTYNWLFSSGPTTNYWANKWGGVTVALNSLQTYTKGGSDNTITLTNGKWYTMNWKDIGYANTDAIFMETSAQPANLVSVSEPTGVVQNQAVSITLTTAVIPSAEEKFYLRYSTDNWATSSLLSFTMTGSSGTATIPGQGSGTTVRYYAFSSTVAGITGNYDLYTLKYNNNSGNNYSYSISGLSSEANILTFTLPEQIAPAIINPTSATVDIEVAVGTLLTSLTPTITVSSGASINPLSGTPQNFSSPFTYEVTAENGTTTRNWTVTVSVTPIVINWANLQWPANGTCEPGQPFNVYGQVWIDGHTGGATQFPALQAWIGYNTLDTDPSTWTNWVLANFNGPVGNNDEFVANLGAAMTTNGTYYYASRYTVNGVDYVYGGYAPGTGGFWNGTTNVSGILTVGFNIDCSTYNGTAYSSPSMPRDNDNVTVYFDATKGNAALLNFPDDVYAHTAVLTNLSTSPSDWRYVKSGWGVNTPATKMTRLSANLYSLTINTPRSYYNVPAGETIQKMVFVFRSDSAQAGGSYLEHRNADGSDIAIKVYSNTVNVRFNNPVTKQTILNQSTTLPVCVSALGNTSLSLYINNTLLKQQAATSLSYMLLMSQLQSGQNWLKAVATSGTIQARDSIEIYLRGPIQIAELPSGTHNGINYVNDSTVTLVLHDPTGFKQYVYAIGEFNNWQVTDQGYMKRTSDGKRYWITLSGIVPGQEYAYQYYIDGELKLADPYAEKVLDPWNDQWISSSIYPNLKPYPGAFTDGVVSIFQTARPAYNWQVTNFIPPALNNSQSDLVIYEMLLRDFTNERTLAAAQAKLDYLKELGVNAIELMPVSEFDGNDSWGYSTNFFFAADKAYGTREDIKAFVDAAHQRGIAVVLDMVVNHAFGLNPMVKMYWNSTSNQPSEHNPWFNQQSTHPYSVGYDYNHESGHTRQFFKDVFQYWLNEYKVDGFRLDLSKGLTQTYSGGDLGIWNSYDQSRINILNDYKAHIKWVKPNAYIILEHFANNDEETVLANSGFLLWSAMHNNYKQVAMGWQTSSNVSWAFHGNRGWSYPNLVDYMETHDEERMLYEALNNGNSTNPMYDIKYFDNGLHHQEQGIVLFMGIPGPKMLYEFQEMGYDYSKFFGGSNVSPKPPRWDYLNVPGREKLNRVVSAMAALRKSDAFRYGNFYSDLALDGKKIWITHSSMDVIVTVNMGVNGFIMTPGFTHAGTWYDYFTGEAFTVSDPGGHFFYYNPGDYRVFTSVPVPKPYYNLNVTVVDTVTTNPISGVNLQLSNAGSRTTGTNGQAAFLALPKQITITAKKFGWLTREVDTLISANTNITIPLVQGWDPASGWANLQWPANGNIVQGQNFNVYAQAWIDGITNQALADTNVKAWIGYSSSNTNPSTWTNWVPASYHAAVGDKDEFTANIGAQISTSGTIYYASRFQYSGGVYVYGGYSSTGGGFWNGTSNVSGILTITPLPTVINWANLQWPANGAISQGGDFNVYGRAYVPGLTGQPTQAPGLQAWVGYNTTNTNPNTWTNWIPATYSAPAGNNDEFTLNLGTQIATGGTYYYAFRYKLNSGAYYYGGYSSGGGGFWNGSQYTSGVLTVTATNKTLNLKAFIEGLYAGAGVMSKAQGNSGDQFPGTTADKVTIELRHSTTGALVYSLSNMNITTGGIITGTIPSAHNGSYYIYIKHRNSVTISSASPVSFSATTITYDFTTGINKAFGSNMQNMGGVALMYAGDVNQDGIVDSGDMIGIDNDAAAFVTGYISNDANGDGLIDSGDMILVDNNATAFIGAVLPF